MYAHSSDGTFLLWNSSLPFCFVSLSLDWYRAIIKPWIILASWPDGWDCRIYRLLLCRGVGDTKQSDDEVLVMLDLRRIQSTPSLPSLPDPLWLGVLVPYRALSMGRIELNSVLMLNWITWNRTVLAFKLRTYAELDCLKWNCFLNWNYTYDKLKCLK